MKTPTGRYAPHNPPMQNIPIRTPEGAAIKRAFADHYAPMPPVDYSALERHMSEMPDWANARPIDPAKYRKG